VSPRRVLLVAGLGVAALAVAAVVVLLKLAEISYRQQKASQGANERATVRDLRAALAARRPQEPPPPVTPEQAAGYRRRLETGTAPGRFAYVAVPVERGSSGRSSFCADASGLLRFSLEGAEPALEDGACPASWLILSDGVDAPRWP
jgi:hypothetical protein